MSKTASDKLHEISKLLEEHTAQEPARCPCCVGGHLSDWGVVKDQCGVCEGKGVLTEHRAMQLYKAFLAHERLIASCKPKDTPHVR